MGLYGYIFGSNEQKQEDKIKENTEKPVLIPNIGKCNCKKQNLYIVTNKTSETILGVYNNLEKAKKDGQKSSYHNCRISQYKLNNCNHLTNVIFEDK
jgi:hypothetical protein